MIRVAGIEFADEGIAVTYMRVPEDARMKGALFANHTLHIHAEHPNYADEIDQLRTLVVEILEDALTDFEQSEPVNPDDEDDDDERGMGE